MGSQNHDTPWTVRFTAIIPAKLIPSDLFLQIFHEFTHKAYIYVQMYPPNAPVHDRFGLANASARLNPPTLLSQKDTAATLFSITDFRIDHPQYIPNSMVLRLFILYRRS